MCVTWVVLVCLCFADFVMTLHDSTMALAQAMNYYGKYSFQELTSFGNFLISSVHLLLKENFNGLRCLKVSIRYLASWALCS